MKRKYVYGLLALPILLFLIYLAVAGESRATFFTEFKHNIRSMMGYPPETYGAEKGLRSEHPDEYGHAYDVEPAEGEATSDDDSASGDEAGGEEEHGDSEHSEGHSEEDSGDGDTGETEEANEPAATP